jgi:hypothetical protein
MNHHRSPDESFACLHAAGAAASAAPAGAGNTMRLPRGLARVKPFTGPRRPCPPAAKGRRSTSPRL